MADKTLKHAKYVSCWQWQWAGSGSQLGKDDDKSTEDKGYLHTCEPTWAQREAPSQSQGSKEAQGSKVAQAAGEGIQPFSWVPSHFLWACAVPAPGSSRNSSLCKRSVENSVSFLYKILKHLATLSVGIA